MHDYYSLVFLLRNFGFVWLCQLECFFLQWEEVLCDGFDLAVSSPSDRRVVIHACIVAIKDKKIGSIPT